MRRRRSPRRSVGLLQLHTVFTRQRQRITSDEEERRRAGFRIVTSYRFQDHGDRPGRLDAIVARRGRHAGRAPVLRRLALTSAAPTSARSAGPTGEPDGFWLDPVTGDWLTARRRQRGGRAGTATTATPARPGQRTRVIPYVQDRRNILVLQLADPGRPVDTALSVMYALERGIEAAFQLEDSELDSELLPPDEGPRDRILFTESAEGGAGVLRRLQAEPRRARAGRPGRRCGSPTSTRTPATTSAAVRPGGHPAVRQGLLRLPAQLRQPARTTS